MVDRVSIFSGDTQMVINPKKQTLVLRPLVALPRHQMDALYFEIEEEFRRGVVMLPTYFDLVVIPKDTDILVKKENNDE